MSTRLGIVRYLNTKPIVYGLETRRVPHQFELVYDVPSACAEKLRAGEVDVALIPSVEYASYQDLSRRYIAELNKPRIRLPSIVGFVGAVGVGIVVGRVIP